MATLTAPAPPAPSHGEGARVAMVFANLLPDEVVAARRAKVVKNYVLLALVLVALLLVAGYGASVWQTQAAQHDLDAAQNHALQLQNAQRAFQPLVTAQAQATSIQSTIASLMATDVQWNKLSATLRSKAPAGVVITEFTATMTGPVVSTAPAAGAGGLPVLNQSNKPQVGTLTVGGTATTKDGVATYVDALSHVTGLASAFPNTLTASATGLTFSISAIITTDALGGRFTPSTTTTSGGK